MDARPEAYVFSAAPLSWESLLSAALWASTEGDASRARADISAAVGELRASSASLGERDKAEAALAFMHRRFLRSYSERQTRLDLLAANGTFNCVSSAALYAVLAAAVGLDVSGVVTKDHAFCAVRVGTELVDVETTSVHGFDPGTKKEFQDAFGRTTGFAYVPPRNYRERSSIDLRGLLSLILSNRVSDLESAGRYREAVGLAVDRWAMVGGGRGEAWDDLVGRLVNYAASLAKAGREAAALSWAARAVDAYGTHPRWEEFTHSAANNYLVKLLRSGGNAQARAELTRLAPLLAARSIKELDELVSDSELAAAAEAAASDQGFEAFLSAAAAARRAAAVPDRRIREIEVFAALRRTESISRSRGWAAALVEIDRLIGLLGAERRLEDARRAYRNNRVSELHNAFASLFNAKRYEEARAAVLAALAEFPSEPRLRSDLDLAERALRSLGR